MPFLHSFFFPFPYKNCVVTKKKSALPFNFSLFDSEEESEGDWIGLLAAGDQKTLYAFTLDKWYVVQKRIPDSSHPEIIREWTGIAADDSYDKRLTAIGKRANSRDTLYVVGHCDEGQSEIASPDRTVSCSVKKLAEYLSVLPKDWPGRLKIAGCESASDGGFVMRTQSFAKQLHDLLRDAGYQCAIYGYTNSIASWATPMPDGQSFHKNLKGVRNSASLQLIQ